jgi:hypothetical protein
MLSISDKFPIFAGLNFNFSLYKNPNLYEDKTY